MSVDDARVGIALEQSFEREQVSRRFEHPARAGAANCSCICGTPAIHGGRLRLQVLKEAMMKVEAKPLRGVLEPILIRRHVVRRMELDAHEHLRRDRDAFLRQVGRDRMDAHELRRQPIGPAEPRARLRPGALDGGGRARSRRIHDLPRQRRAIRGIFADQTVQVRSARSRQADDEHGRRDALLLDARVCAALRFHAQQVVEQAHDELAHGDPAECRERGLVAIRLQQPLERLGEVPRAVPRLRRRADTRHGATNLHRAPAARRRACAVSGRPGSSRGPRC